MAALDDPGNPASLAQPDATIEGLRAEQAKAKEQLASAERRIELLDRKIWMLGEAILRLGGQP